MADPTTAWEKIQQGVKETERLIGQRQYNLAMIKARQTLEYMVKSMGEKALIVDGDISDIIDQLYDGRWITKTTKEHYHRIRLIGNKAVHEGNNSASDATSVYQLLSQEVYAFANEYNPRRKSSKAAAPVRPASGSRPATRSSSRPAGRPVPRSTTGARTQGPRRSGRPAASRRRRKKQALPLDGIIRILIPIICVILLIFIIRALAGKFSQTPEESSTAPTPEISTTVPQETIPEIPETTEAPPETTEVPQPQTFKTTASSLNVRKEPSTSADILVKLPAGSEVTVIGVHDDQWSIISYEGQDAYVSRDYLTPSE